MCVSVCVCVCVFETVQPQQSHLVQVDGQPLVLEGPRITTTRSVLCVRVCVCVCMRVCVCVCIVSTMHLHRDFFM